MARVTPPTRMADIADGARRTFAAKGYQRTQVADVAKAVGLSPAALYRHVESKEALFHLAFVESVDELGDYVATPPEGATVQLIAARLRGARLLQRAKQALAHPADDPIQELREIITDQYRAVVANWQLLALVEASAADRPDIAERYFRKGRRAGTSDLARFVAARVADGSFREVTDPELLALQIRESCAWFGWHRRGDPDADLDDEAALASLVEVFVRAVELP
jgi:AcrR family transcriptional regulator